MSIVSKLTEAVVHIMPDRERDELSDAQRIIGKPIDRVDGRAKVTGKATFTAEFKLDNLAHAALAYGTIARGKITKIDSTEAEKAAGVVAVITHENALKMNPPPVFGSGGPTDAAGSSANVLNTDEIHWNGQPVAMVVAETLEQAEFAAGLIKVSYKETTGAKLSFEAGKEHAETPKHIFGEEPNVERGDAEKALSRAKFKVDQNYTTPPHIHNAIELHATTAVWEGDQLTVYDATQYVRGVADSLAKMFSLDKKNVRVVAPFVGGGFGGKCMWFNVQLAVMAAKMVKRPVKLVMSREGVYRTVGWRTPSEQRVALGCDESGALTSLIQTGLTATSFNNDFAEPFSFAARHMYQSGAFLLSQKVVRLDTLANTFMRAPGEVLGIFTLETALDELAHEAGIDPVELRLRNDPAKEPIKGREFSSRHFKEAYRLGAEKFGWEKRKATREGKWLIGHGVASAYFPAYRFPAAARVRLNADGTAVIQSSAQEMGMGTATVQTQHAAERLGLPMEKIRFDYGDTDFPTAPVAGGSAQAVSVVLAVQQACEKLQREVLSLAKKEKGSALAEAHFDDVIACDGGLFRRDKRDKGETYAEILARAKKTFVEAESQTGPPLEMAKYAMGSYGAQFCEVRVNEETGETRVSRWVGAFDVGRILNSKTASSQLMGGIIMGIGMALTEDTLFDERSGRIMNPSLAEYHVPVNADVPKIETYFLDIPDPHMPVGARGVGEIGITGVAAAIGNAIYNATGKRLRDLPFTLDKLL